MKVKLYEEVIKKKKADIEPCCKKMKTLLDERVVFYDCKTGRDRLLLKAYGSPVESWEIRIEYCPFCGKKIEFVR